MICMIPPVMRRACWSVMISKVVILMAILIIILYCHHLIVFRYYFDNSNNQSLMNLVDEEAVPSILFISIVSFDNHQSSFEDEANQEMWKIKELVGSIHRISRRFLPRIIIIINDCNYEYSQSNEKKATNSSSNELYEHSTRNDYLIEEIEMWKGVETLSLSTLLTGIRKRSLGMGMESKMEKSSFNAFKMEMIEPLIINHFLDTHKMVIMIHIDCQFSFFNGYSSLMSQIIKKGHVKTEKCINSFYGRDALISQYKGYFSCLFKRIREECLEPILPNTHKDEEFALMTKLAKPLIGKKEGGYNYCHLQLKTLSIFLPRLLKNAPFDANKHLIKNSSNHSINDTNVKTVNRNIHQSSHNESLSTFKNGKIKICFGIPVKGNAKLDITNQHFFKSFLSTLLTSISPQEYQNYDYRIYLGYDNGDPIYDYQNIQKSKGGIDNNQSKIISLFKSIILNTGIGGIENSIQLTLFKLPNTQWLTFIWNYLFIQSVLNDCDYFYQGGDDIEFQTAGWTTFFLSTLQALGNIGVVGPNDIMWKCSLLTQSMVHVQTHWSIFGYFYPMEIKDWYSDNWITLVYGKRKKCFMNIKVTNEKSKRRYSQCDRPPWKEALKRGQEQLSFYFANNHSSPYPSPLPSSSLPLPH